MEISDGKVFGLRCTNNGAIDEKKSVFGIVSGGSMLLTKRGFLLQILKMLHKVVMAKDLECSTAKYRRCAKYVYVMDGAIIGANVLSLGLCRCDSGQTAGGSENRYSLGERSSYNAGGSYNTSVCGGGYDDCNNYNNCNSCNTPNGCNAANIIDSICDSSNCCCNRIAMKGSNSWLGKRHCDIGNTGNGCGDSGGGGSTSNTGDSGGGKVRYYLNESSIFLPVGWVERKALSSGLRMSKSLPSTRAIWRSIFAANIGLCVAIRAVIDWVRTRLVSMSNTASELYGSRFPVGSSARSRLGALAIDLAMATRCCSPPESSAGLWESREARPTSASFWAAISDAVRLDLPAIIRGSITFSCAVKSAKRLCC